MECSTWVVQDLSCLSKMASPCALLGIPPGYTYYMHQWLPYSGHTRPFTVPSAPDYRDTTATISRQDELALCHALLLWDRVRHIELHLPPSILHKILMVMDEPFPMLEHLSIASSTEEDTKLVLPKTFLAPKFTPPSIFQKDYGFSPTLSPSSRSCLPTPGLLITFSRGRWSHIFGRSTSSRN